MKKFAVLLAVVASAVGATGAFGSSKSIVRTAHTSLGTVLVNSKGLTLYLFEGDTSKHLGCNGKCLKAWFPVTGAGRGQGLRARHREARVRHPGDLRRTRAVHVRR